MNTLRTRRTRGAGAAPLAAGLAAAGTVALAGCAATPASRPAYLEESSLRRALVTVRSEQGTGPRGRVQTLGLIVKVEPERAYALVAGVDLGPAAAAAAARAERGRNRSVAGALAGPVAALAPAPADGAPPPVTVAPDGAGPLAARVVGHDPRHRAWLLAFDRAGAPLHQLFATAAPTEPGQKLYLPPSPDGPPGGGRLELRGAAVERSESGLVLAADAPAWTGAPLLDQAGAFAGFAAIAADGRFGVVTAEALLGGPLRRWIALLGPTVATERRSDLDVSPFYAQTVEPSILVSDSVDAGAGDAADHLELRLPERREVGFILYRRDPRAGVAVALFDINGGDDLLALRGEQGALFAARKVVLSGGRYRIRIAAAEGAPGSAYHLLVTVTERAADRARARGPRNDVERRETGDPREIETTLIVAEVLRIASLEEQAVASGASARVPPAEAFAVGVEEALAAVGLVPRSVAIAALDALGSGSLLGRLTAVRLVEAAIEQIEGQVWDLVRRADMLALESDEGMPGLRRHGRDPRRIRAQGRAAALLLIARHPRDGKLFELIGEAAGEIDPALRWRALTAALESGDRRLAVEVARRLANDPVPRIRDTARDALGERR